MERAVELGLPAALLSEQYRMHPSICSAVSAEIYGGEMQTAAVTAARPALPKPCRFVLAKGPEKHHIGGGFSNAKEAFT